MAFSPSLVDSREFEERVYAGVLGKIIGVYLGRPFEGWTNERIESELGEVDYYVHKKLGKQLIVTDDDITGTFTFVRALPENGNDPNLTAAAIGDWWLNTIVENKSILWWGGLGMSTEHTAYHRLKHGLRAPDSGSIATNGARVAEQIGGQIFIDGWGIVAAGDPDQAAHFARLAASVSHDGAGIHGAQVIAAMEAQAFIEPDLGKLLDTASGLIPRDSVTYRLIGDMREWAADHGDDWRATFKKIQTHYGYDKFGGNCHMVPNHAVVLLGLLHGKDDFQRAQMITNTAGWDTDCNAGNVGCLMGIKNGLAGLNAGPDWRGPVADRLFLPAADGGRAISDALRETYELVNIARALAGLPTTHPKGGARFHFTLPGSVQGFLCESAGDKAAVSNIAGQLALCIDLKPGESARAATATFIPPANLNQETYELLASPTLYSGQRISATVIAHESLQESILVNLYIRVYGANDLLETLSAPRQTLAPGQTLTLSWQAPDTGGKPIAEVGIEATAIAAAHGTILLDRLTWTGTPDITLAAPQKPSEVWRRAWVNGAHEFHTGWVSPGMQYRVVSNEGTRLVSQGEWSWTDYEVSTSILPHLAKRLGVAVCIRGLRRYVAIVLDTDHKIRLIHQHDDSCVILAESDARWEFEELIPVSISVTDAGITAKVGEVIMRADGANLPTRGSVGMMVEEGNGEFTAFRVRPESLA